MVNQPVSKIVLVLLMLMTVLWFNSPQTQASPSSDDWAYHESIRLATEADFLMDDSVRYAYHAGLLATRALNMAYTPEAYRALYRIIPHLQRQKSLSGHTDFLGGALQLSNGRILTWGWDGMRLWDETGDLITAISDDDGMLSVLGAVELADGHILSWGGDSLVRIWDADGQLLTTFPETTNDVTGGLLLSDGHILTWGRDNILRVWDVTGQMLATFTGHTGEIGGAIELADGRIVSWGETMKFWNQDGELLKTVNTIIRQAIELSDGRILSWGNNSLQLWDSNGELISTLPGYGDVVRGAMELADGRILSWGGRKHDEWTSIGSIRVWDRDGHSFIEWGDNQTDMIDVSQLANGHILSHSWYGGVSYLWDTDGNLLLALPTWASDSIQLRDGRLLTWNTQGGDFTLWEADMPITTQFNPRQVMFRLLGARELRNGQIVGWGEDHAIVLWNPDGTVVDKWDDHNDNVWGVIELADGNLLSWSMDGTLRTWALDGRTQAIFEGHTAFLYGAIELADGRILSWGADDTLRLWERDGRLIITLTGHTHGVDGAIELENGQILSWARDENDFRLWDADGVFIREITGHADGARGALQLADGRILTWGGDAMLHLLNADFTFISTLQGHHSAVYGAMQLRDGRIVSWENNKSRLWDSEGNFITSFIGSNPIELSDGRILSGDGRLYDANGALLTVFRQTIGQLHELMDGRILSVGWYDMIAWQDYLNLHEYACAHVFRDFTDEERELYDIRDENGQIDHSPTCPQFAETTP